MNTLIHKRIFSIKCVFDGQILTLLNETWEQIINLDLVSISIAVSAKLIQTRKHLIEQLVKLSLLKWWTQSERVRAGIKTQVLDS